MFWFENIESNVELIFERTIFFAKLRIIKIALNFLKIKNLTFAIRLDLLEIIVLQSIGDWIHSNKLNQIILLNFSHLYFVTCDVTKLCDAIATKMTKIQVQDNF